MENLYTRNKYISGLNTGMHVPKRLTNSLYNINDIKKISINTEYSKDNLSHSVYPSNNNLKNLKKNMSFQIKKTLNDFKHILKQTEKLKKRINSKHTKNASTQNFLDNKFNDDISIIKKEDTLDTSNIIDDFLDLDINFKNNKSYKNIIPKPLPLRYRLICKEKKNIKSINKDLIKSNIKLIEKNNSLEKKIDKFKDNKKIYINQNNKKILNYYDQNLIKFINNLKISSYKNINANLQLTKDISNILNKIQLIYDKYNLNNDNYSNSFKILKNDYQKIRKLQINDDITKLYNLKDEQDKLNKQLKLLKINLNDLKNIEKNLSIKYESELKSKQDFEELVYNLKNTIKNLNNENLSINNKSLNNKNSLDLYEMKIKQLNSIIKSIENQKKIIIEDNNKLKKDNQELNVNENNEKAKIKENELKQQLNDIKNKTNKNKKYLEKKDNQIKLLKNIINKLSKAMKENKIDTEISNLNIEQVIKDDKEDIEFENLLKENKLEEDIKKELLLNEMKLKEIDNINKTYEDLINIKNKEINFLESRFDNKTELIKILEDKVKPLYKKSIISKEKSFTNIKKNYSTVSNGQNNVKINKNNNIMNSHKNIHDVDNKYEYIINTILSKNNNKKYIINNINKDKHIPYKTNKKINADQYIK